MNQSHSEIISQLQSRVRELETDIELQRKAIEASCSHEYCKRNHFQPEVARILDRIPSMVGYWDKNLRHRYTNQAYKTWLGMDPRENEGKHIREVIGEERYRLNWPYIEGALRGEPQTFERAIPTPNGEDIRHSLADYIPDVQNGEVQGFFVLVSDITPLKLTEKLRIENQALLQKNEELFRAIVQDQTEVISRLRGDGTYIFANEVFYRFFGVTPERLLGNKWHPMVYADDLERVSQELTELKPSNPVIMIVNRVYSASGQVHWMEFSNRGTFDKDGQLVEIQSVGRDITSRRETENQLRKLSMAVEQSPSSIIITNINAEIEYVNAAFEKNTGYCRNTVIGKNPNILQSKNTPRRTIKELWETLSQGHPWKGELYNKRKDDSEYIEHVVIAPVRQADGRITHYVAVQDDITASKMASEEIHQLAFFDSLTGLPNRRLLMDRLQHAVKSFERHQKIAALLLIDLDNFKTLNDTLGHETGDILLQQVAQRLVSCVRESDTVARLGGDEFVVILENLSIDSHAAAAIAKGIAESMLEAVQQPYTLGCNAYLSSASIGVTLFAKNLATDSLMRQADLAMYKAKDAGRNAVYFFNPEMQATVIARAQLNADLSQAINDEQFELYYQPQVIGEGLITGAEVLLRWNHPLRGLILPGSFISAAEETGLILRIGQWALHAACAQLANWSTQPELSHLTLSVNVSARQLEQPNFVDEVLATIDQYDANPNLLKLELTENMLINQVEEISLKMAALKLRGVSFSLDDFGTGYSSLSYLKLLPLDQLKIDRGFVRDILDDQNDAAIAQMIVALGKAMGISVIAEGVELAAQRDFLAQHGCHAYQGYLFGKPMPYKSFELFAKQSSTI